VDLGEWTFRDGTWVPVYEVVRLDDADAVREEVKQQFAAFRQLIGGMPTHLDSHQHVHLREPVRSVLAGVAGRLNVPLRRCTPRVQYCGDFYGQMDDGSPYPEGISVEGLLQTLRGLPQGVTELACHPGEHEDWNTMYRAERACEVKTLCNPRVRDVLTAEGIELVSFRGLPSLAGS
jgi:predicted glycoside hydrolase/deacetylase ChbG (UPF0249 family)